MGPVPYLEGSILDQLVLDDRTAVIGASARLGLRLRRGEDGQWSVDCGRLIGVGENSILAVHPPGGEGAEKPIGYVKVIASGPLDAKVVPTEYAGLDAPSSVELAGGYCEPVYIDLGSTRLRLAVDPMVEAPRGGEAQVLEQLRLDLKQMALHANCRFELVGDRDRPEWVVRSKAGQLQLLPAEAARIEGPAAADMPCFSLPADRPLRAIADLADRIARAESTRPERSCLSSVASG